MLLQLLILFAEEGAAPETKGTPRTGSPLEFLLPIGFIILLFYIIVIRPMRRQEQEAQEKLSNIEKGDKVLTIGGIYGHVVSVAEKEDEIVVKLDDNVRVKIVKSAIHKNFGHEERLKAASEKKEAPKA